MSHTPGPWEIREYNDGDSRPSWTVIQRTGSRATPWIATVDGPENARLMAAAPVLLAFAEDVLDWEQPGHDGTHARSCMGCQRVHHARAAIAKARGDS